MTLGYAGCCKSRDATPLPLWLLVVTSGDTATMEIISVNLSNHQVLKALSDPTGGLGTLPVQPGLGFNAPLGALLTEGLHNFQLKCKRPRTETC